LTEVGRGEATDEAVNAETAHGLVTESEAGGGVAAHDQPPPPHDLSVLVDGEDARPEGLAGAAGEDAEMVRILEVLREHDVASVEEGRELGDGEVPDPPGVLVLVGDAGVEDEAPPRRGSLVHGPERLDEQGQGASLGNHLHHALPDPGSELRAERDLGGFVALPAGVVGSPRVAEGEPGLGHDHAALGHSGGDRIEGAETFVPVRGGHEN
jgi:hypothetical protein